MGARQKFEEDGRVDGQIAPNPKATEGHKHGATDEAVGRAGSSTEDSGKKQGQIESKSSADQIACRGRQHFWQPQFDPWVGCSHPRPQKVAPTTRPAIRARDRKAECFGWNSTAT
jgi:hypothetical protein